MLIQGMSETSYTTRDERPSRLRDVTNQAKIYAARMRLQNAVDQADALDAIREIAGNLIGTEELAIFKVDKKRSELWLYWSFGVDPNKYAVLEVSREPKLKQVLGGKCVYRLRLGRPSCESCSDFPPGVPQARARRGGS